MLCLFYFLILPIKFMDMETEKEKAAAGLLYNANYDSTLQREMYETCCRLYTFNQLPPWESEKREQALRELVHAGANATVLSPFHCDYGYNIEIGDNFFANVNLVILDGAKVKIGNNVFIAPNVGIYTAGHPFDVAQRNSGLEYAYPITIGNNVWIGAGVSILPGVTIGDNTVVGAGSVVNRSLPSGVLAVGNPCRVIRRLLDEGELAKKDQE